MEKGKLMGSGKPVGLAKEAGSQENKLAAILVRGLAKTPGKIKDSLAMLRLLRKNQCVIVENEPVGQGMLKKVKDYITWGEIDEETFRELVAKRGAEWKGRIQDRKGKYNYTLLEINGKKYRPCFHLNPPRKGFGRKGIKVSFKAGGALGYRGGKINDLLKRMI